MRKCKNWKKQQPFKSKLKCAESQRSDPKQVVFVIFCICWKMSCCLLLSLKICDSQKIQLLIIILKEMCNSNDTLNTEAIISSNISASLESHFQLVKWMRIAFGADIPKARLLQNPCYLSSTWTAICVVSPDNDQRQSCVFQAPPSAAGTGSVFCPASENQFDRLFRSLSYAPSRRSPQRVLTENPTAGQWHRQPDLARGVRPQRAPQGLWKKPLFSIMNLDNWSLWSNSRFSGLIF